ncbi:MAG: YkgJ family cysteine cluster protein [Deltaproteobacteria bacterium]|nr:YkgJ family cysteine cluster protein [Deltaproteobacteria bacterium]MBW2635184.1 YkgJ family cysteine cluster protein [Deltaproteobacteria bacterium]
MQMTAKGSIFLTTRQALDAVCMDFRSYEPQIMLFSEVLRVISNGDAIIKRERGKEGRWVAARHGLKMVWFDGPALGEYVCRALNEHAPDLEIITSVCSRVFQTHAYTATDSATGLPGVCIETGMENFACQQCGNCCNSLDYRDALGAEDVAGWKRMGRRDILEHVQILDRNYPAKAYRIWVKPGTHELADRCPFLEHMPTENRWTCCIHDVKPSICRDYPVSRKHGMMTGCPGFNQK